jgi:intracellular sulfur oxidation DsrE/DsrF family protein
MSIIIERRSLFRMAGGGAVAIAAAASLPAEAAVAVSSQGKDLAALTARLAATPRRRSFEWVPLIVTDKQDWDHEAAALVLAYRARSLQVWEPTELAGPWPALMREAMNGQVFALGNRDFLPVAAIHGLAHLALFDQALWDRYNLAKLTGGKFAANSLIVESPGVAPEDDLEKPTGFYGPANNNIRSLQRRGAVLVACHDSIHAIARMLQGDPDFAARPADMIAADLTNGLIPDAVLVPSVVAFLVELQRAGFTYSKGG